MSLEQTISKGIMEAMKAKDPVRVATLRNVKKYIIEARTAGPEIAELPDEAVVKIIAKLAKQGADSAAVYAQQNRQDLADEELAQVAVLQEFLPKRLTDEELTAAVREIIAETGAQSPKEMGKVMGVASKRPAGPTARRFRRRSGSCSHRMAESRIHRLQGRIHHNIKTVSMPMGMLVGALLCRPIVALENASHQLITPALIFLMLFFTFCRVRPSEMRIRPLHGWLLLFQVAVSAGIYGALLPVNEVLAQGAMICVLAPVAMAAVVIGGMLGANVTTMATYSLLCNMAIALVAPVVLSLTGNGTCTFWGILARVVPLLVLPFVCAQLLRFAAPAAAGWIAGHSVLSFYMWLVSLTVVIGRTTSFILDLRGVSGSLEIGLALVSLVICLVQFKVGRSLGRRYGDPVAGGQSLGQKNTVLAVWMAQSFLNPVSSIAPTAYIVWQNFVNSYQIYKKDREGSQRTDRKSKEEERADRHAV